MKLLKKILAAILTAASVTALSLAFTACDDSDEKKPCNHTYGSWETVSEASCTADGEKKQVCTACNDVKTEKITATGHTAPNSEGKCASCGEVISSPAAETYTVTVKDNNGALIQGAVVQIFVQGSSAVDKTTGADGKLSFDAPAGVSDGTLFAFVKLISLPEGYKTTSGYDSPVTLGAEKNITIQNGEKLVLYRLKLVDASGNAMSGVKAQICIGDGCKEPTLSDENGYISVYLSSSEISQGVKGKVIDANYYGAANGSGGLERLDDPKDANGIGRGYAYFEIGETELVMPVIPAESN